MNPAIAEFREDGTGVWMTSCPEEMVLRIGEF